MPELPCVRVAIPRWQWRTFGADLTWLLRRLPAPRWSECRPVLETHLICRHSSHHAWLRGPVLTLQWRKEENDEGFELWDTILRAEAPLLAASMERLFSAWGMAAPQSPEEGWTPEALLAGPIAATPSVLAVEVARRGRCATIDGLACSFEVVTLMPSRRRLESFTLEHEDPALMNQFLGELGLESLANVNFLEGLKRGLELPPSAAKRSPWARKSSASS